MIKVYYLLVNADACCTVVFSTWHAFVYVGKLLIGGLGPPNPRKNENIKPKIRPVNEP